MGYDRGRLGTSREPQFQIGKDTPVGKTDWVILRHSRALFVTHTSQQGKLCVSMSDTPDKSPLQELQVPGADPAHVSLLQQVLHAQNATNMSQAPQNSQSGQDFLRKQLQELGNTQAVLSARTTEAANGRAIYKQKCAIYHSDVKRQDKHSDRLLRMHKINSDNAARAGLPPPAVPELDNRVLQPPELPACNAA